MREVRKSTSDMQELACDEFDEVSTLTRSLTIVSARSPNEPSAGSPMIESWEVAELETRGDVTREGDEQHFALMHDIVRRGVRGVAAN